MRRSVWRNLKKKIKIEGTKDHNRLKVQKKDGDTKRYESPD